MDQYSHDICTSALCSRVHVLCTTKGECRFSVNLSTLIFKYNAELLCGVCILFVCLFGSLFISRSATVYSVYFIQ